MRAIVLKTLNRPFPYLNKTKFRIIHVGIILVYSIIFLEVFDPFNASNWLEEGWRSWFGMAGLGMLGSIVIASSQLIGRRIIKFKTFKTKHFILWFLCEILLTSILMAWIYGNPENPFFIELKSTLKYTSLISVLPYSFSILLIASILHHKEKSEFLDNAIPEKELVSFKDERDQIKFSIKGEDLLFLESTDNYVTVYFLNNNSINKEMVRTSLKKIEELNVYNKLTRCHRSYMVNIENVLWIKKEGRNYVLKLKNAEPLIPVSRSYVPTIKSIL